MYALRIRAGGVVLDAEFSGRVSTEEALRAVSQGFALAEAGNIERSLCDLRGIEEGPESLSIIAAAFSTRLMAGQRVALLVHEAQLPTVRRFGTFTHVGGGLGAFSRASDAEEWLAKGPSMQVSTTLRRHLLRSQAQPPETAGTEPSEEATQRAG